MIEQRNLIYKYDSQNDILNIFAGKIREVFSDEIFYGLYENYDRATDEFAGISIMNYTDWNLQELNRCLSESNVPIQVMKNNVRALN